MALVETSSAEMATCHSDRQAYALGLCNSCYQRKRYADNPDLRKRTIARAKSHQKQNHPAYIAQKVEYNRRTRETARYEKWAAPRRQEKAKRLEKEREILYATPRVPSMATDEQRKETACKWAANNREKARRKLLKRISKGESVARAAAALGMSEAAARRYLAEKQ